MNLDDRLSRIETVWSVLHRAHTDQTMEVRRAQEELLEQERVDPKLLGDCRPAPQRRQEAKR